MAKESLQRITRDEFMAELNKIEGASGVWSAMWLLGYLQHDLTDEQRYHAMVALKKTASAVIAFPALEPPVRPRSPLNR